MAYRSTMAKTNTDTGTAKIEIATRAEISRQIAQLTARRAAVAEQLAAHFEAHGYNEPGPPAPDVVAARQHARVLLNGHAPAFLSEPPTPPVESALRVELAGIDLALKILGSEELAARAVETVAWQETHLAEWKALCANAILAVVRVRALDEQARLLRKSAPSMPRFPLIDCVGVRMLSPDNPLLEMDRVISAAIGAGILTKRDIEKAEKL
jgi:hypothetical protein